MKKGEERLLQPPTYRHKERSLTGPTFVGHSSGVGGEGPIAHRRLTITPRYF